MHISFDVSGHYDWERADLHPGVQVTAADVKALRAKQDAEGAWLIRVEKTRNTHHDASIPEAQICYFMLWQAVHAGNSWSRHDAACELMKHSYKHHGKTEHILDAHVLDGGASEELIDLSIARCLNEYREQLEEEALNHAGIRVVIGTVKREDGSEREETFSEALARAKEPDAAKAALAGAQDRINANLASAKRSTDGARDRYLAKGVDVHAHVRAHFTSHIAKEQP